MRLLRIVPGCDVFTINIGEENLVDELKDKIKEMAPELKPLRRMRSRYLNQINVDISHEKKYIESQQAQPGRLVGRGLPIGPP